MRSVAAIFLLVLITSCKPSLCECVKNMEKGENADKDMTKVCQDIYNSMSDEELKKANRDISQCK